MKLVLPRIDVGVPLSRVLAQVEVTFSNSMIEAFWRSLKHQWLFLNSLDSVARLRTLVAFFVEEHKTKMPHAAFRGEPPRRDVLRNRENARNVLVRCKDTSMSSRAVDDRARPGLAMPWSRPPETPLTASFAAGGVHGEKCPKGQNFSVALAPMAD